MRKGGRGEDVRGVNRVVFSPSIYVAPFFVWYIYRIKGKRPPFFSLDRELWNSVAPAGRGASQLISSFFVVGWFPCFFFPSVYCLFFCFGVFLVLLVLGLDFRFPFGYPTLTAYFFLRDRGPQLLRLAERVCRALKNHHGPCMIVKRRTRAKIG